MTTPLPPAPEPAGSADAYVDGVREGDLTWLARTVTLVESTRPDHRALAAAVLERLAPQTESATATTDAAGATTEPDSDADATDAESDSDDTAGDAAATSADSTDADTDHAAADDAATVDADDTVDTTEADDADATHGDAIRVGVTGPPGAGKSTLIDALGSHLCEQGRRVGVLAVDPSSARSGGSLLGDKTRMARLAANPAAFVRPSPSGGALGGVTGATLEAVEVVEAAGFDVVFVETVGVGQSEAAVADICDTVLAVVTPAGGDDLQGIKRGLFEVTDIVVVNKADGPLLAAAQRAVADYAAALKLLHPAEGDDAWQPPVLAASALEGSGLEAIWQQVQRHVTTLRRDGNWATRRGDRRVRWMWRLVEQQLFTTLRTDPSTQAIVDDLAQQVRSGHLRPARAAAQLVATAILG